MGTNILKCIKLEHGRGLDLPNYATLGSAGVDLRSASENAIIISPFKRQLIPTGLAIELQVGFEAQIRPRSGLAANHGISVLNSPGTIDCDYRGEIKVILINLGEEDFVVNFGDKVAQMVISKYEKVELVEVTTIDDTDRGHRGFGSTGIK